MTDACDDLRTLVSESLERRGVLSKLRAELRKHVFMAIEEDRGGQSSSGNGNGNGTGSDENSGIGGNADDLVALRLRKIEATHTGMSSQICLVWFGLFCVCGSASVFVCVFVPLSALSLELLSSLALVLVLALPVSLLSS
jgi:hypothetical protein